MTVTPFYRGENYSLERLSCGQAVQLGMAASGLEPRESCLRLAYMFTLCTELSPILPCHRHWFSIQSCITPVLCFFLSDRLQALRGQEPNLALLLCLQKHQPHLETCCSCAPQMLTELRRLHRTAGNSLGLRKPGWNLCFFNQLCDLYAIHSACSSQAGLDQAISGITSNPKAPAQFSAHTSKRVRSTSLGSRFLPLVVTRSSS